MARTLGGKLILPTFASPPSSPATGQVYFDTTLTLLRIWNGSKWVPLGGLG